MTTIRIPEADLLALLGENGEHWTQGTWGNDKAMCLHGAIRRCQPVPGDAYLIQQVAARLGWGVAWNDDDDTDWAQVRERLAHVEITDTDLADTFGPQWQHILALVRRCAILTADEAQRLATARETARDAALEAAWRSARATAGHTAWHAAGAAARATAGHTAWHAAGAAARAAARDAAGAVAGDAAGDAARALAMRDLIGQHGFTQEHYDTLTRPWRTVIGPIHPDDAPMVGQS